MELLAMDWVLWDAGSVRYYDTLEFLAFRHTEMGVSRKSQFGGEDHRLISNVLSCLRDIQGWALC